MHRRLLACGRLPACAILWAGAAALAACASACTGHPRGRGPSSPGDAAAPRPRIAFLAPQVAAPAEAPPLALLAPDGSSLGLRALSSRTSLDGPLAATELHLTFHNAESRAREGRFRIVLPHGAFLSRLAMKIDGTFRDADVAELGRAREVYESVMHARRDPLLVEQHGDEELSARVFPIAPDADTEIIVSWIETVSAAAPIALRLRGLAGIGRLDVVATQDGRELLAIHDEEVRGHEDVELRASSPAAAVRSGDLLVARVVVPPAASDAAEGGLDGGLVVLVDTSASIAPGLEHQLALVQGVIGELAPHAPKGARLTLAAFDQAVVPLYRGPLAELDAPTLERMRTHGALGASDLEGALGWAAGEARAVGATRALIVGDGLATAGSADPSRLRAAARALAGAGVRRLDVVAVGELRSDATLRALVVGALPVDGTVSSGSRPTELASRLTRPVRGHVKVEVPGARWFFPTSFEGVQPGDERFVYAELAAIAPAAVRVAATTTTLTAAPAPAPLLARAVAKARVDALVAQGEARGYDEALRERIVRLSQSSRVPSPFTAFLVTESEADRAALLRRPPPAVAPSDPPAARASAAPVAPAARRRTVTAHVPRTPQLRAACSVVSGRLPPEIVQKVVRQSFGRFRACYDLGLLRRGHLAGRVTTKFVIDLDGTVRSSAAEGAELGDKEVVDCIAAAFQGLEFPRPEGGVVTVLYPIVLAPLEPGEARSAALADARAAERSPMLMGMSFPSSLVQRSPRFFASSVPPEPLTPWSGPYGDARAALEKNDVPQALAIAGTARARDGRDVLALLALGESLEAASLPELAARAYGSIADLHPHSAEMLRVAAGRLDALGAGTSSLAIELFRRAKDDRPDHPTGHHALAMALLRAGAYEEAFETLRAALRLAFHPRYADAHGVLDHDLAFVASAWMNADPSRAGAIEARARLASTHYPTPEPSRRFVLSWETDASDLDLALTDAQGAAWAVQSSVTDGYGPESSVALGARGERSAAHARVRFSRRGPGGLPIGVLHVMEDDGRGHVSVRSRPFVVMTEGAEVDLGTFD